MAKKVEAAKPPAQVAEAAPADTVPEASPTPAAATPEVKGGNGDSGEADATIHYSPTKDEDRLQDCWGRFKQPLFGYMDPNRVKQNDLRLKSQLQHAVALASILFPGYQLFWNCS